MKSILALAITALIMLLKALPVYAYESYQTIGESQFRWLFFDLYSATLSSPSGVYNKDKWPLALRLTYHRNISKDDLIETTESEWHRLELSYSKNWLERLNAIWPDVKKNDSLLLHVNNDGISTFYHNDQAIGSITDKAFSATFLSIWLSENTRDKASKNRLINAADDM